MGHHETLGVSQSANASEIKDAFRNAAKELHPDHSDSPEAAEAFIRIREARDALLKEAENAPPKETVQASTASAVRATTNQAYTKPATPSPAQTDEEIAHQQALDRQAARTSVFSLLKFRRKKESNELKRHRHRIKTNNRRLDGKY